MLLRCSRSFIVPSPGSDEYDGQRAAFASRRRDDGQSPVMSLAGIADDGRFHACGQPADRYDSVQPWKLESEIKEKGAP